MAFEGAKERLREAADHRKRSHDLHVREVRLEEGQFDLVRQLGSKGRNKFQDVWGSVVHKVVKAPREEVPVYTVAPVDNDQKLKTVHRSMLKPVVWAGSLVAVGPSCSSSDEQRKKESLEEGDLVMGRTYFHQRSPNRVAVAPQPAESSQSRAQLDQQRLGPGVVQAPSVNMLPLAPSAVPTVQAVAPDSGTLRRTQRSTAGQHSNVHHLPRPVGSSKLQVVAPPSTQLN